MKDLKQKFEELKSLGLDEKKIVSLTSLAFQEFLEEMEQDLVAATEEDLEKLELDIKSLREKTLSSEDAAEELRSLLKKVYGISAEGKWLDFLDEYLADCIEDAKYVKDFLKGLENDDPETLKKVIAAQQDPDFNTMKKLIEESSTSL